MHVYNNQRAGSFSLKYLITFYSRYLYIIYTYRCTRIIFASEPRCTIGDRPPTTVRGVYFSFLVGFQTHGTPASKYGVQTFQTTLTFSDHGIIKRALLLLQQSCTYYICTYTSAARHNFHSYL